MLQKIRIQNYQSHKNTVLDLHKSVNCIVGASDVGKTAIIRALRWLVWNRPLGNAFISDWSDNTKVTVISDDTIIKRIKSDKENKYIVDNIELEAVRTDVPDEVRLSLNFNDLNLQRQFDRPFLLDSSPGEVAQHFNAIAHIDVIDSSNSRVQSWIRGIQQSIESDSLHITELESQLEQFVGLEDLDGKVADLEQKEIENNKYKKAFAELTNTIWNIERIDNDINREQQVTILEPIVTKILTHVDRRKEITELRTKLNDKLQQLFELDKYIEDSKYLLKQESAVQKLLELINQMREQHSVIAKLLGLTMDFSVIENKISKTELEAQGLQKAFNEAMPNVCPLCNQKILK